MPPVSWLEIRKWNGSQWDAFEELCCQFAHSEMVPENSKFFSKGRPDSGIECYWVLPTGEEWGWQAKYFTDGISKKRWEQCDESVKKALEGHPKLTKYFFCIPFKFPDSRKPDEITAAQQWKNYQAKWMRWAEDRGRTIEFVLWDEHELLLRLSKPEHQGRCWFWFNTPAMDADWFKQNIAASVLLADERYTKSLHFELPLAQYFDALAQSSAFFARIGELCGKLDKTVATVASYLNSDDEPDGLNQQVWKSLQEVLIAVNSLVPDTKLQLAFSTLQTGLIVAQEHVQRLLYQILEKRKNRVPRRL